MQDKSKGLIAALAVLAVLAGIGGYALGAGQTTSGGTVIEADKDGLSALASEALSDLNAQLRGNFAGYEGSILKIKQNDQAVELALPEYLQTEISLQVIEPLTDEDKQAIEDYQQAYTAYQEEVEKLAATQVDTDPAVAGDDLADYPTPPQLGFDYSQAYFLEGTQQNLGQVKITSQQVKPEELKEGDLVSVYMNYSQTVVMADDATDPAMVEEAPSEPKKTIQVTSLSATRNLVEEPDMVEVPADDTMLPDEAI